MGRTCKLPDWVYNPDQTLDELYEFKIGDSVPPGHGANVIFAVDCWGIKRKGELFVLYNIVGDLNGYAMMAVGEGAILRNVTLWNTSMG